jgi:hypothetical protein
VVELKGLGPECCFVLFLTDSCCSSPGCRRIGQKTSATAGPTGGTEASSGVGGSHRGRRDPSFLFFFFFFFCFFAYYSLYCRTVWCSCGFASSLTRSNSLENPSPPAVNACEAS